MTLTIRLWFEEINLVDGLGSQLHHFAKFRLGGVKLFFKVLTNMLELFVVSRFIEKIKITYFKQLKKDIRLECLFYFYILNKSLKISAIVGWVKICFWK